VRIERAAWLSVGLAMAACAPRAERPPPERAAPAAVVSGSAPGSAEGGLGAAMARATSAPTAIAAVTATATATATPAASATAAPEPDPAVTLKPGGKRAAEGRRGMIASEDEHATRAGVEVLSAGGNAVDAAVAVGYALAVVNPSAGPLGGGGFMIVRLAGGEAVAIDFRETAPAAATQAHNDAQLRAGAHGYASAPVPGIVAGLDLARARFGTLPLERLLAPAVKLAREGHRFNAQQARLAGHFWQSLRRDPEARAVLGRPPRGLAPTPGGLWKQPALATTLEAIARQGDPGFYAGETAARFEHAMRAHGGLVTAADLAGYRAKVREPLRIAYRGLEVLTMPPPSMGGIALASMLLNLAHSRAHEHAVAGAAGLHLFIEASRRGYADRRAVGADPDAADPATFGPMLARLLDPAYHATRAPAVSRHYATDSRALVPIHKQPPPATVSPDTTHFSVVDATGNAVSCTMTLSAAFGARVVVPGTGVLLSNAMGAFSPNGVNALAPGKRMASSMTPVLLVGGGKTVAVLGSPGGDTIPATVTQLVRNLVDGGMTVDEAVEAGRIVHPYLPDEVRLEKGRGPGAAVRRALEKMGHKLRPSPLPIGAANCIVVDPDSGTAWGHADSREGGLALGPP
jgi:gamma-glutamyltranspeptidase/glutathione hydrolase